MAEETNIQTNLEMGVTGADDIKSAVSKVTTSLEDMIKRTKEAEEKVNELAASFKEAFASAANGSSDLKDHLADISKQMADFASNNNRMLNPNKAAGQIASSVISKLNLSDESSRVAIEDLIQKEVTKRYQSGSKLTGKAIDASRTADYTAGQIELQAIKQFTTALEAATKKMSSSTAFLSDETWRANKQSQTEKNRISTQIRQTNFDRQQRWGRGGTGYTLRTIAGGLQSQGSLIGNGSLLGGAGSLLNTGLNMAMSVTPWGAALEGIKALADGVSELGRVSTQAYDKLQMMKEQAAVVFGGEGSSSGIFSQLQNYATTSPYGMEGTLEMATLLKQSGVYESDVINTIKMIGDTAMGSTQKMKQIAQDYAKIAAAGYTQMREIRQFANAGIPIYRELSKTMGVSQSELKRLVRDGQISFNDIKKTFENMTGKGGVFENGVNRMAATLEARKQNLSDIMEVAYAGIGELFTNLGDTNGTGGFRARFMSLKEDIYNGISQWSTEKNVDKNIEQISKNRNQLGDLRDTLKYVQENKSSFSNADELIKALTEKISELTGGISVEKEMATWGKSYDLQQGALNGFVADILKNQAARDMASKISLMETSQTNAWTNISGNPIYQQDKNNPNINRKLVPGKDANEESFMRDMGDYSRAYDYFYAKKFGDYLDQNARGMFGQKKNRNSSYTQAEIDKYTADFEKDIIKANLEKWQTDFQDFFKNTYDAAKAIGVSRVQAAINPLERLGFGWAQSNNRTHLLTNMNPERPEDLSPEEIAGNNERNLEALSKAFDSKVEEAAKAVDSVESVTAENDKYWKQTKEYQDQIREQSKKRALELKEEAEKYKKMYAANSLEDSMAYNFAGIGADSLETLLDKYGHNRERLQWNQASFFTDGWNTKLPDADTKWSYIRDKDIISTLRSTLYDDGQNPTTMAEFDLDNILSQIDILSKEQLQTGENGKQQVNKMNALINAALSTKDLTEQQIDILYQLLTRWGELDLSAANLHENAYENGGTSKKAIEVEALYKRLFSGATGLPISFMQKGNMQDSVKAWGDVLGNSLAKTMSKSLLGEMSISDYMRNFQAGALQRDKGRVVFENNIIRPSGTKNDNGGVSLQDSERTLVSKEVSGAGQIDYTKLASLYDKAAKNFQLSAASTTALVNSYKASIENINNVFAQTMYGHEEAQYSDSMKGYLRNAYSGYNVGKNGTITAKNKDTGEDIELWVNETGDFLVKEGDHFKAVTEKELEKYTGVWENMYTGLNKLKDDQLQKIKDLAFAEELKNSIKNITNETSNIFKNWIPYYGNLGVSMGSYASAAADREQAYLVANATIADKYQVLRQTDDSKITDPTEILIKQWGTLAEAGDKQATAVYAQIAATEDYTKAVMEAENRIRLANEANRSAKVAQGVASAKNLIAKYNGADASDGMTWDGFLNRIGAGVKQGYGSAVGVNITEGNSLYQQRQLDAMGGEFSGMSYDDAMKAGFDPDTAKTMQWMQGLVDLSEEFSKNIVTGLSSFASSALEDTFTSIGQEITGVGDGFDNMGDRMRELGKAALSNLSSLFVQAGLSYIAANPNLSGLAIGAALIAAGGMAGILSGMLTDEDSDDSTDKEYEKLQNIKEDLADLIEQARTDALYYENELRHRNALQLSEDLSSSNNYSTAHTNDAIISPNGDIITTHPDDWLIATKDPQSLSGNSGSNVNISVQPMVTNNTGMNLQFEQKQTKDADGNIQIETIINNAMANFIASADSDSAFNARAARQQGKQVFA